MCDEDSECKCRVVLGADLEALLIMMIGVEKSVDGGEARCEKMGVAKGEGT